MKRLSPLALFFLFSVSPLNADQGCKGHSCNNGDTVTVDTPVSVESTFSNTHQGSKAIALGAGDMDINDYYRSYGVAWGAWQGTQPNPLAVAKDLALEGRYEEAAMLRCSVKTVRRAFGGAESCIERLGTAPMEAPTPEPTVVHVDEDDDDRYRELEERIEQMQRPIIKRVGLSAEQKAALREVKE